MRLDGIHRFDSAVDLIQRGMRISIVSHLTGLPPRVLRSLHHEIHGVSPPAGQMPSSTGMLATRSAQAMASVFAAFYRSVGGVGIRDQIELSALLTAHDLYLELVEILVSAVSHLKPIDINQAWVIARDIQTGALYFSDCRTCDIRYLCATDTRSPPGCPICALKRREGIRPRQGKDGG